MLVFVNVSLRLARRVGGLETRKSTPCATGNLARRVGGLEIADPYRYQDCTLARRVGGLEN